ncbi:hypothetical protein KKH39_04165 [Patescibacteria group bacterium]|nr:hypothetical protein [Patescibacteria group bacterium]
MFFIVLIILLKFAFPVLILKFPFFAGWANFILDSVDGDILIPLGLEDKKYQLIDKIADYTTYIFIVIWGWKRVIKKEVIVTFLIRTIGQFSFFFTRDEMMLFYFPNLVEPLFLIYATAELFKGREKTAQWYKKNIVWIWLFILAYKFQDEWFTHVANVDRTEFFKNLFKR